MFLLVIFFSILFVFSSSSLVLCWVGLEINTLAFIPLLLSRNSKGLSDVAIKYFLTQALASVILLLSFVISPLFNTAGVMFSLLFLLALLIKLGAAPFHAWVPSIVEPLSWGVLFILLTLQKLNPLFILLTWDFFSFFRVKLIFLAIFSSLFVGRVLGLSQVRVRMLLTFSSINHIGWVLSAFILGFNLILFYFFTYMLLLGAVVFFFAQCNLHHVNQISSNSFTVRDSSLVFFNLLSLGGLPPFLGFLPKWCVLQATIELGFYFLSLSLILARLIVLYFYLRLTFSAFILKKFVWLGVSKITLSFEMLFFNLLSLGGLTLSFLI